MDLLPVAGPWITQREIDYAADAARRAWYEEAGLYVRRFERTLAASVGRRFAIALPSCTSGIHLALAASGIGPGDEVVVPESTWIATAAPVCYVGATPAFADVDPQTWCLTPDTVAAALTPRTRAVVAVDLYGNVPDMAGLSRLARERDLLLVEDAAEAIGSRRAGRMAGAFGDVSVFSFHGSKTLVTGEGGMLLTDDEALWRRCLFLRDHGREPGDVSFRNREVAFKYKMSDLQAAVGLAQAERLAELVDRKRRIFGWYRERLEGHAWLRLNRPDAKTESSYWMVTAVLDAGLGVDAVTLMARLREQGVDSRPFFPPLSSLPAFADLPGARLARARNETAYDLAPRALNLPSALRLTEADVDRACAALVAACSPRKAEDRG